MRGWEGSERHKAEGKGEGRARLLPGGEWVRLPPSSRAGRRTQRIRNQGEEEEEEEAGRRAD